MTPAREPERPRPPGPVVEAGRPDGIEVVEVVRSGVVESVHRGSLVVVDAGGAVSLAVGAPWRPQFTRSANKPVQAVGMLRAGLDIDARELALVSASHSGEVEHVQLVARLLARAGAGAGGGEELLACPPAWPMHEGSAHAVIRAGGGQRRRYMNCSGKHAGMLLACRAAGWPVAGYTDRDHPLQLLLRRTVAEFTGEEVAATGVDGCGAPLFALTLTGMARAYHRLVTAEPGTAPRRVADAMRAHPRLVAGSGRLETEVMAAAPGILLKGGAEGVLAGALADGTAFAIKIDDGAMRAIPPLLAWLLRRLGATAAAEAVPATPVLGGGEPVGELRVVESLAVPGRSTLTGPAAAGDDGHQVATRPG